MTVAYYLCMFDVMIESHKNLRIIRMTKTKKKRNLPHPSIKSLDRELLASKVKVADSTRSTFTLTPEAYSILDKLGDAASITQREIFDQAVLKGWIDSIAEHIRQQEQPVNVSEKRTLVISRTSLDKLKQSASDFGIPRDALASEVIKKMLVTYNAQVLAAQKQWSVIKPEIRDALQAAIDYAAAFKHLDASDIPEELRENVKSAVSSMLDVIVYCIEDEDRDDYLGLRSHIRGSLSDIRSIAENLEAIEISEFDLLTSSEKLEHLKSLEEL